ncbi:hypothetical protein QPK31_12650 [Massilia sp. YIM B02769]|uniref:hypothetical protein n=1 Tax=Massilia sp. YIM B02769 TaxID=3050129 RepID=UPI0025B686E6|nr:hypothetical protein [Massilia sp. YIM B02769]MDN4059072.1 hypothetical protein [Massilia sp. YIM B02769]
MSRSIVHLLLSLLLLLAQQASILHVATDWGSARGGASLVQEGDAGLKPGKLPGGGAHDACALCMDSAQLAFALPLPVSSFLPLTLSFDTPPGAHREGVRLLARWSVQPRGPPQA